MGNLRCDICKAYNGSCNQYMTADMWRIVICPSCLAWSDNVRAVLARQAHKEGRLISSDKKEKKGAKC